MKSNCNIFENDKKKLQGQFTNQSYRVIFTSHYSQNIIHKSNGASRPIIVLYLEILFVLNKVFMSRVNRIDFCAVGASHLL